MRSLLPPLAAVALLAGGCGTVTQDSTDTSPSRETGAAPSATAPPGETADAAYVFDGDSLEMVLADGSRVEVRLLGLNAPEGRECFGDQARAALEDLLTAADTLTLVTDDEESDQFGRALRYLYADGVNVNLTMLATGNALAIQTGHHDEDLFAATSDEAFAAGLGMWGDDACGAEEIPMLSIADYVFDADGRDAENPNGEWVAIANEGPDPVALTDWVLRDESTQHRFIFPDGYNLPGGAEVSIHSGCGNDTTKDLYWCAADPVWSNGGDTIILQLPSGTVVARTRYAGDY